MYESTFYTFAHPDYFEPLGRLRISQDYFSVLKELLPPSWTLKRSDVWLQTSYPGVQLPHQGFKIHLSCRLEDGVRMIKAFAPVCVAAGTTFKIIADPRLHRMQSSKRYHRGGSGKFATIYPHSEGEFHALLAGLRSATTGLAGPYILSDRRLQGSKVVFYRYGGIVATRHLQTDGTFRHFITSPDGEDVNDPRFPYVTFPDWVQDPFPEAEPETKEEEELLNGRYEVLDALEISNSGGVYRALDTQTGQIVAIKEARAHCLIVAGPAYCVANEALEHEAKVLKLLSHLPGVPDFVDFYREWEHDFLVQSFFDGIPLGKLRVLEEFILCTNMHRAERIFSFCTHFRRFTLKLISMLKEIHATGVIIGDISPGNVLYNRETEDLCFVDLEAALYPDSSEEQKVFGENWSNPGFRTLTRQGALAPKDDFYSLAMLLYSLVCPIQGIFLLDKQHPTLRILHYFIGAGLSPNVLKIIKLLMVGDADAAASIASSWQITEGECQPISLSLEHQLVLTGLLTPAEGVLYATV